MRWQGHSWAPPNCGLPRAKRRLILCNAEFMLQCNIGPCYMHSHYRSQRVRPAARLAVEHSLGSTNGGGSERRNSRQGGLQPCPRPPPTTNEAEVQARTRSECRSSKFRASTCRSSICPTMEVPAAFREFAEKGVTQAKDNWEKMKAATEEATDLIEDSYATASKGCRRLRPQDDRSGARQHQCGVRLRHRADDREVAVRGGRAVDRAYAQAVRCADRADQGTRPRWRRRSPTETAEPIKESVTSAFKKVA